MRRFELIFERSKALFERDAGASGEKSNKAVAEKEPNWPLTLNCHYALAHQGDYEAAEANLREAIAMNRTLLGAHTRVASILGYLGNLKVRQGDYDEAETAFREALAIRRERLGADHVLTADVLHALGMVLLDNEKPEEAATLLHEALAIYRTAASGNASIGPLLIGLGTALAATGRTEEGKARLLEGRALVNHTDEQRETLQRVVTFYETWGNPKKPPCTVPNLKRWLPLKNSPGEDNRPNPRNRHRMHTRPKPLRVPYRFTPWPPRKPPHDLLLTSFEKPGYF